MRLDQYLVKHKHFESREKARQAIEDGQVIVNSKKEIKSSHKTLETDEVQLDKKKFYVSRAAKKLEFALRSFSLSPKSKLCLDVGSSTGGFSQILLEQGAKQVDSVDVGSNQMHPSLAQNPKLKLYENTDIRNFKTKSKFDLITVDVSFISLRKIMPCIKAFAKKETVLLTLFKPQFEVGKEYLKKGISKHPNINEVLNDFAEYLSKEGLLLEKTFKVPLKGKEGNQEYFLLLSFQCRLGHTDKRTIFNRFNEN
ncbi:TlyA family RNA methyltransferase [Candidatus Peregrinibacteria bacterium]|nr:TlyA family RNA methyltransferase [Candidatus Peregrinibacteria bacterium]